MSNHDFTSHFNHQAPHQDPRNHHRNMHGSPAWPNRPFVADSITLVNQPEMSANRYDPFAIPSNEPPKQGPMYSSIKPENVTYEMPLSGQIISPSYSKPSQNQPNRFDFTDAKVYSGNQNKLGSPGGLDSLETRSRQALVDRRFVKKSDYDQKSLANTTNSRQLNFGQTNVQSPFPLYSPKKSYLNKFEALGPAKGGYEQSSGQKSTYISGNSNNASQKLLGSPGHHFKSQSTLGSQQIGRRISNNLGGNLYEKEKKAVFLNNKISEVKNSINETNHQIDELTKRHNLNLSPVNKETLDKLEATVQNNQKEIDALNSRYARLQKQNQKNREILGKYYGRAMDGQHSGLQGCEGLLQENEDLRLKYSKIQTEHEEKFKAKKAELKQMSEQQITHESLYLGFRYANQEGSAFADMKRYLTSLQEQNNRLNSGGGLNQSFLR